MTQFEKAKQENFRRPGKRPTFYMQHWLAIAATLLASKPDEGDVFDFEVWKKIVFHFGQTFGVDNDRFSKSMFYTSCGLPPKKAK